MKMLLPFVLLLSSCDALGPMMAKFVPPMELLNEEWAPISMECDENLPTRSPRECVAKTLKCGDVVEAYSGAGKRRYTDEFFVSATCTTMHENYEGAPEMIYKMVLPPQSQARARLVSDCADLDVFAMMWNDKDDQCPKVAHARRVGECQMDISRRGGTVSMTAANKPITYLIGVTGKQGARGNFRLSVECGL